MTRNYYITFLIVFIENSPMGCGSLSDTKNLKKSSSWVPLFSTVMREVTQEGRKSSYKGLCVGVKLPILHVLFILYHHLPFLRHGIQSAVCADSIEEACEAS